ncbi:MAG: DegT/DnrJ/EryC1/StrS family aminotransferase [Bacteroidales bacterium]
MKSIQMVDLHGQYLKIKTEIDSAIQQVIASSAFIKGEDVHRFQEELSSYMEGAYVVACGNGTDALQVAMMALDPESGDEVITTPFTFIATVEVIRLLGLKPVLVDVREDTFNLDPVQLRNAVTDRTRGIVPVHLFGQCAHMEPLLGVAREKELFVIEDTAQALGADYIFENGRRQKAGTLGTIGTTSFFPSKNLGCYGDGGALFTRDALLADKMKALVNHGMKTRYYYDYVGVNSRLDTLQAAILRVKLKSLEGYHRARQQAADFYDRALGGLQGVITPVRSGFSTHVYHQYTLRVPDHSRDELREHLKQHGVPSMVYYPVPLHLQKAYEDLGYRKGDLPVAESLSEQVLSLPMHTELEEEQQQFICDRIVEFYK